MNSKKTINKSIFLLGYMGTGKTSVGRVLAEKLGLDVVDTDDVIVAKEGISINEIFAKHGEEYFRQVEARVVAELAEGEPVIISCGGGVPLREENRRIIKENGISVLLTASAETIYQRIKNDDQRPLLKDNMTVEHIQDMLDKRIAAYEEASKIVVDTENKSVDDICQEIIKRFSS